MFRSPNTRMQRHPPGSRINSRHHPVMDELKVERPLSSHTRHPKPRNAQHGVTSGTSVEQTSVRGGGKSTGRLLLVSMQDARTCNSQHRPRKWSRSSPRSTAFPWLNSSVTPCDRKCLRCSVGMRSFASVTRNLIPIATPNSSLRHSSPPHSKHLVGFCGQPRGNRASPVCNRWATYGAQSSSNRSLSFPLSVLTCFVPYVAGLRTRSRAVR
jgi:hypothetical protein